MKFTSSEMREMAAVLRSRGWAGGPEAMLDQAAETTERYLKALAQLEALEAVRQDWVERNQK